jgi:hypothetical protein
MQRDELAKQILEEQKLRRYVRRAIKIIKERKNQQFLQEEKLRGYVRELIKETGTDVPTNTPHKNTGVNALSALLQNIIPTIEDDYKQLTSNANQRLSFRAHLLKAIQNALAPIDAVANAPRETMPALAEAIDIEVEDQDKFIPARKVDMEQDKEDKQKTQEEEEDTFGIPGQDETGRNFAERSFDKVENQIIDAYTLLPAPEDKETFYDYLLTNFKLYFDKFEDELAKDLEEPTTDEYEEIKSQEA